MAWTQADIEALERAIADGRGARQMTFNDQTVVFNSPKEMLELLEAMKATVATASTGASRTRYAGFSKGV